MQQFEIRRGEKKGKIVTRSRRLRHWRPSRFGLSTPQGGVKGVGGDKPVRKRGGGVDLSWCHVRSRAPPSPSLATLGCPVAGGWGTNMPPPPTRLSKLLCPGGMGIELFHDYSTESPLARGEEEHVHGRDGKRGGAFSALIVAESELLGTQPSRAGW